MKNLCYISLSLFITLFLKATNTLSTEMFLKFDSKYAELSSQDSLNNWDVIILTLRLQESIKLDTLLAKEIDQALDAARMAYDTLKSIHARPDYTPTKLILCSDAQWTQAWRDGNLLTGNQKIDSLTTVYQMTSVKVNSHLFLLNFAQPLKMTILAKEYAVIPGIINATPNILLGDGNNIEGFKKNNTWHLVFSRGWGDCPAGCINRYYWYVTVDESLNAQLVEEMDQDFTTPRIYTWNIPPRYAATVFSNADEIFFKALPPPIWWSAPSYWWVRRHAVEVIGRLFIYDHAWVNEDLNNISRFETLRSEIQSRRHEVVNILTQVLNDTDPDVRASAQWVLNQALGLEGGSLAYYFPMHMNNQWTFSTESPFTETIIDTVRIEDSLYFCFDKFRSSEKLSLRMTHDNRLLLRHESSEQVWLDFSAEVGDSWPVSNSSGSVEWTVFLQSKTDTVIVPAGTFMNCYRFWFSFGCCDNDWVEWYAPGIGPVKRILYGIGIIEYPLIKASINNIQYPTAVSEPNEQEYPLQYVLFQNYPNPFNSETIIRYQLPSASHVLMNIFNVKGQKIRTLFNGDQEIGDYQIVWDGKNDRGINETSGIYFFRIQSDTWTRTIKIMLLQ